MPRTKSKEKKKKKKRKGYDLTKPRKGRGISKSQNRSLTKSGLNIQEERFAYHYLENPNATEAAKKAGYAPSYAAEKGCKLLKDERVKQIIRDGLEEMRKASIASATERREILSGMARSSALDFVQVKGSRIRITADSLPKQGNMKRHAIKKISTERKVDAFGNPIDVTKIDINDPIQAINTLNKMDGIYTEKVEHSGSIVMIDKEDQDL